MKIEGKIIPGYLKALTGLDRLPGPNGERSVELFRHAYGETVRTARQ